jgi:hypothetical protein
MSVQPRDMTDDEIFATALPKRRGILPDAKHGEEERVGTSAGAPNAGVKVLAAPVGGDGQVIEALDRPAAEPQQTFVEGRFGVVRYMGMLTVNPSLNYCSLCGRSDVVLTSRSEGRGEFLCYPSCSEPELQVPFCQTCGQDLPERQR